MGLGEMAGETEEEVDEYGEEIFKGCGRSSDVAGILGSCNCLCGIVVGVDWAVCGTRGISTVRVTLEYGFLSCGGLTIGLEFATIVLSSALLGLLSG